MAARLTIVVPVLNEASGLAESLRALAPLRARGHEVIVVDGGSDDASVALAVLEKLHAWMRNGSR